MNNIGNPFVECTSRDMSFKEVFQYWCNPFTCYAIDYNTLTKSTTPIIVEGPRGSGKTMILKYISYFCQKELLHSTLKDSRGAEILDAIRQLGSLGIYFRYKDDFGTLFRYLNCSKSGKEQLFLYYFEMYVLDELFRILLDMEEEGSLESKFTKDVVDAINNILHTDAENLQALNSAIKSKIQRVDKWVRKSRYLDSAEETLQELVDGKNYILQVCRCIGQLVPELSDVRFLVIIDEYENAGEYQRILNTLLKQVDHTSNVTYRIGVRPRGMLTLETNVGTEFLQIDRDFLLYVLQTQKMTDYKAFIREIANRRLKSVDFFAENGLTDIQVLLGTKENLDEEARALTKNNSRKHFEILKKKFFPNEYTKIIDMISCTSSPLMEMLNIVWILRGIPAEKVRMAMQGYLAGRHKEIGHSEEIELARKYKLDYSDKYRSQMMFILLGIYAQNKKYYSFNTFAYLSSGAVNDFISLCRNVFYLLDEFYYDKASSTPLIPIALQAKGAENTAIEQMDKIRLCSEYGTEMYSFAMNIGGLFKLLHRDIYAKYPETNQFAFENEVEIESRPLLKEVRNSLIKWGVIVKRPRIQSISIGRRKGTLYYLNRIFSPIFGISFRTRGGYNFVMSTSLFESLLKEAWEAEKIKAWKDKKNKNTPLSNGKNCKSEENVDPNQISMFEV